MCVYVWASLLHFLQPLWEEKELVFIPLDIFGNFRGLCHLDHSVIVATMLQTSLWMLVVMMLLVLFHSVDA